MHDYKWKNDIHTKLELNKFLKRILINSGFGEVQSYASPSYHLPAWKLWSIRTQMRAKFFQAFFFLFFFFVQFLWMLFNWEDHSFLWNQLQVKTSFISFILENWVAVEQFQSLIMKRQASLEMNRQLTLWYSTLSNTPLVSFLRKSKLKFITVRLISHTAQD